jgi:DNA-binding PadR family transcriptional regulator
MARKSAIGEFEHLVLLAALRLRDQAYAPEIARVLEEHAKRDISRGTLYAALERLETRGLVEWHTEASTSGRGGHRRRRFSVTEVGTAAVADQRQVLIEMWNGIEDLLPGEGT